MKRIFCRRIKNFLLRNYTHIYGWFHRIEKKILFISFGGRQYSDNPRAISEKFHELYPDYKIVWGLQENDDKYSLIPSYVVKILSNSLLFYRELATSKIFITNEGIEPNIFKRKGQFFIQTWHGDRGFKKILYECYDDKNKKRPIPIIDNDVTDLFIVGSENGKQKARDAFHYQGEIFCVGMPRNDKLIYESVNYKEYLKKKIGLDTNKKILLYAPTFQDKEKQEIKVDLNTVINHLNKKNDEDWICILRFHFLTEGFEINEQEKNKYIDLSDYPDMADLLLISDMLLTDYSSSSGDFILKQEPVILLHYDLEEYNKNYREFRVSPKEAGFYCVKNDMELIELIDDLNYEMVVNECDRTKKFYGINESGKASELVSKRVYEMAEGIGE